jgi:hypothetical protein
MDMTQVCELGLIEGYQNQRVMQQSNQNVTSSTYSRA